MPVKLDVTSLIGSPLVLGELIVMATPVRRKDLDTVWESDADIDQRLLSRWSDKLNV